LIAGTNRDQIQHQFTVHREYPVRRQNFHIMIGRLRTETDLQRRDLM